MDDECGEAVVGGGRWVRGAAAASVVHTPPSTETFTASRRAAPGTLSAARIVGSSPPNSPLLPVSFPSVVAAPLADAPYPSEKRGSFRCRNDVEITKSMSF